MIEKTLTATQVAQDREALFGKHLIGINGEPVGGSEGWLIEHVQPQIEDGETVGIDITVWVGEWMIGLFITTHAGRCHPDQTVTFRD